MVASFPNPKDSAFAFTGREEGGLKPEGALGDPNRAMEGVNQSTYNNFRRDHNLPLQDVALMSESEKALIYGAYWKNGDCDEIALKSGALAICHFDTFFNGGGAAVLEETLGETVPVHPVTEDEVQQLLGMLDAEGGENAVCIAYLQNRWNRFQTLHNPTALPDWKVRLNHLAAFIGVDWRPA